MFSSHFTRAASDFCVNNHNLGVMTGVRQHGTAVYIDYENGEPCKTGRNTSTTVNLVCDPTVANYEFTPDIVSQAVNTDVNTECHREVTVPSSLVCGVQPISCQISANNLNYDLSPLSLTNQNYRVVAHEGTDVYEFLINVCRPLAATNTTCPPSAAVCQTKPSE